MLRNLSLCFIIRSSPGRSGEVYLAFKTFRLTLGPNQPLIQWVQQSFRGVTAAGPEGNHSPPSSSEVKNDNSQSYLKYGWVSRISRRVKVVQFAILQVKVLARGLKKRDRYVGMCECMYICM